MGQLASFYTDEGYDILFFDYRGFGKSDGKISSQNQLYDDVQAIYETMKKLYDEKAITLIGYSIGTAPAAYLATNNDPRKLVLIAPYYSLTNVIQSICPVVLRFLVKYKLETYKYISECTMPVIIFHGDKDEVINYENSIKLAERLKDKDRFVSIERVGHNDIYENNIYKESMIGILAE